MRLFRKKKKDDDNNVSDKVAGKIAGLGIALQKKFAAAMNKLFEKMSYKRLKIWLAVFCITCGGYSMYILANAVFSKATNQQSIKIDPVKVPKHYDNAGDEMLAPDNAVGEETFQKIQAFKKYMDSLKLAGSKQYDSILTARPYLMDTVLILEQIYYSQKQK